MKNKYLILCFTAVCAVLLWLLPSCEKEFNPRDEYKDITIIYGLINPVDSIHYIRINKAFLGPESIIVMAKNPDSSTYPVEDIDVRIYEVTPNGNSTQLTVGTTIIHNKDSGYFYYPDQMVYYFEKTFDKKTDNTIKIEVEHKKTGKIVYAQTSVVNAFNVYTPRAETQPNFDPEQTVMKFEWDNAKNGKIYDVYYTMYYREGSVPDFSVFRKDSVVWHMGTYSAAQTGNGSSQVEIFQFNPGAFYSQVAKKVPYNTSLWRSPYSTVKFAIWCGSEELYYYHNINSPSQGLAQERPEYTNLKTKVYSEELGAYQELEDEAFGLFSSRIVQYVPLYLSDKMWREYLPGIDRQFTGVVN